SKSAPHSSSSRTRSGASLACSSAMRQLLSSLPPRMVSRKWTCQLSSGQTLPMAAAMPPSAMTVCALPSSDLQTIAVRAPSACASIAARNPAPPAPTMSTSYSCVSYFCSSLIVSSSSRGSSEDDPRVDDCACCNEAHVHVGDHHAEQAEPGVQTVALVQSI